MVLPPEPQPLRTGFSIWLGAAIALVGSFVLTPAPANAQPANANCATPEVVLLGVATPLTNTGTGFLTGIALTPACATLSPPLNAQGQSIAHPVYFRYDALASGIVRVEVTETQETGVVPHDPRVAVLEGLACPPDPAAVVACADGGASAVTTTFTAQAGQSYLIVVGGTFVFGTADSMLTLSEDFAGVSGLVCAASAAGAALSWTLPTFPPGLSYDAGIHVFVNDGSGAVLHTVLPLGTETQFDYVAPSGFAGTVELCVEGVSTVAGPAPQACCTLFVGTVPGPANDDCPAATPLSLSVAEPFETTCANTDTTCQAVGPEGTGVNLGACLPQTPQMTTLNGEVFFCFQAGPPGTYRVQVNETQETHPQIPFEPRVAVLDTCVCPPLASAVLTCADTIDGMTVQVDFAAQTGQQILIAVGGLFAFGTGAGTIEVTLLTVSEPEFRRGDCNGDGMRNIADAIAALSVLFPPGGCTPGVDCPQASCLDACDTNDDGSFNIADAVALLTFLFPPAGCMPGVDCPVLPAPAGVCGFDPSADALDCAAHAGCP